MDQVKDTLKKNTAILDPYGAMVPAFVDLSAKADVNPGLIVAAIGSVASLIIMILQGWTILVTFISVLYPTVHSIRAIESPEKDDDKKWLTYWMVLGVFTFLETFVGFIFYFIPYWDWVRLGFFVWLILPNFDGAMWIYTNVLRKLLDENKALIARYIEMTKSVASDAQSNAMSAAKDAASDPNLVMKGMNMAAQAQTKLNEATGEAEPPAPVEGKKDE